ncbi:metallophosphoesterase family protein [Laribacter hongkongensis]|uniref:metallophosphoesterase family protein n=1 Tax=Laribacter hongkongensis TaxID=168471 RepID=UPI001EFD8CF2|nr:metallophosphoesterase [Laribacter hongkongensis]MCG9093491.1 hypothetical protein [Laribacter hongkongensis]
MRPVPVDYDAVMKIAAISDIHGNLAALDAVLADIRLRGADLIVNLVTSCPARCNRARQPAA